MKTFFLATVSAFIQVIGFGILILGICCQFSFRITSLKPFRKIGMLLYNTHHALFYYSRFVRAEFTDSDVIVGSFPRSGTNWICMIVFHLLKDGNIKKLNSLTKTFLHLENCSKNELDGLTAPRIIFSHLPFNWIYRKRLRYIYCIREGKDVSVSYFRFLNDYYLGRDDAPYSKFPDFFDSFCKDHFGEISLSTNWFKHTNDWLKNRGEKNIFIVKYEEMHETPSLLIQQIAKFLNVDVTPQRVNEIIAYCSFQSMKQRSHLFDDENKEVNHQAFTRKGIIGDWVNYMTEEQKHSFDREIKKYPELQKMYPQIVSFNSTNNA